MAQTSYSSVIANRAKSAVVGGIQSGLVNVAGNLLGVSLSDTRTLGPAAVLHEKSRGSLSDYDVDVLSYPLNVGADPQQGHYIMFNINVQTKGRLKLVKEQRNINDVTANIIAATAIRGGASAGVDRLLAENQARAEHLVNELGGTVTKATGGKPSSAFQVSRPSTSRITTCIALYMPPSVQTSYAANYNDQKIGVLAEIGHDLINQFRAGSSTYDMIKNTLGNRNLDVGLQSMVLATLDTVAPGAKALFALERGKIITPRMELMFDGIGRRNFSFAFTFIPKSEKEAKEVQKIIYEFKYHMAADFSDEVTDIPADYAGSGPGRRTESGPGMKSRIVREMDIPSTFDIEYKYLHGTNNYLNKISTCVLSKLDVEYGSDRFIAHKETKGQHGDGAPPLTTKLTLAFTELELITKGRIEEGY